MTRLSLLISASAAIAFLLPGCAQTEHTEAITAEITAAQMEGRDAARKLLSNTWNDTTGLHRHLEEARKRRQEFADSGKTKCAEAFDSTFVSTIRTVRPDLDKKIRKQ